MLTDDERARLEDLKRSAREREPLPPADFDHVPADIAAACALLEDYLWNRPSALTTRMVGDAAGDRFLEVLIAFKVLAKRSKQP